MPGAGFLPAPGRITRYREPGGPGVRVDSGVEEGGEVVGLYDPMIAKLLVWDADRPRAIARMRRALDEFEIEGVPTLLPLHRLIFAHPAFQAGETCAGLVEGALAARLAPAGPAEASLPAAIARTIDVELDGRRHEVRVLEPVVAALAYERQRRDERRAQGRRAGAGGRVDREPDAGNRAPRRGVGGRGCRIRQGARHSRGDEDGERDRRRPPRRRRDLRVAPGDAVRSGQVLLSVVDGA